MLMIVAGGDVDVEKRRTTQATKAKMKKKQLTDLLIDLLETIKRYCFFCKSLPRAVPVGTCPKSISRNLPKTISKCTKT